MKKNLNVLLIVFLTCLVWPAQAQLKFGIKGGANISSVHISAPEQNISSSNITGFHVGPMMEVMLPIVGLGVDAAVLYSQKGVDVEGQTLRNDYLDVPVNLKWKFGLPIAKVYLAAGPYIGFHLGGDKVWEVVGEQWKSNNFSAGLNFGAGVEVIRHLQVGVNYGLGLTDNYSAEKIDLKAKDRGWSITAAILF